MLPAHRRNSLVIIVMLFMCASIMVASAPDALIVNRSFYGNSTVDVQNGTVFTVRLDYTINSTARQEFVFIAEKLPDSWSIIGEWHNPFLNKSLNDYEVSAKLGYQGNNSSTGEYEWAFADIYPLWNLESKGVPSGYLTYDVWVPGNTSLGPFNISGKWRNATKVKDIVDLDNKTYNYNASSVSRGTISNSTVTVSTNDTVGPYISNVPISEFDSTDSDTEIEVGEGVTISFKVNDSSGVNATYVYIDDYLINTTTNPANVITINVSNTTLVTKGLHNVSIVATDNNSKTSFKNVSFFVYNDYFYWKKLDAITLMMADRSGHADENNYIKLEGGYTELLPINISVNSQQYPDESHKIYTNVSGQNIVTAKFKGLSTAFANQNVTIWRIKIPNSSKAFDISFDKMLNETLTDYDTERFTKKLDSGGDVPLYNNKAFEPGSYILLVTVYDNPNNDTTTLGILSFTFFNILDYDSYVNTNSSVVVGQSFNATMNLENASLQNYTYSAILLKNYTKFGSPTLDISFTDGIFKINGEDYSNYSDSISILKLLSSDYNTSEKMVNSTNATHILTTNTTWAPGDYLLLNYVYSDDLSNRSSVAYKSTSITLIADTISPTASIYTSSLVVDEDIKIWFNANNSSDNVGIVNYSWDLDGNGSIDAYGPVVNRTYSDPGSYTITLNVTDAAGNYALNSITLQVLDATPPVISNVSNGTASNNSVSISWDTNELSNSTVRYGFDINISNMSSQSDSTFVLNHTIVLFNLTNDKIYYYMVNSSDQSGNSNNSTIFTFNTTNNTDNESPFISNAYLDKNTGLTIGTVITVTVNVTDNIGVSRVTAGSTNLSRRNATHWNGTITANATASITIYAYDAAGNNNSTILTYTLYVAPPPSSPGGGGGGGGGGGTSGEEFENILCSEVDRQFVGVDQQVSYSFEFDCNYVKYINFTSIASSGKIAAKVETLDHTSSLVDIPAPDIVFKNINVWAGNMGWFSENNIEDPTIMFSVERTWVTENDIKLNTITFYSYNDVTGDWEKMSTRKTGEDSGSYQFTASLPIRGILGPMAISGRSSSASLLPFPTFSPTITPTQTVPSKPTPEIVPGMTPITWTGLWKEEVPGFQVLIALFVLVVLSVTGRRRD
ncbi:MAG: PGF-pre-PGF domain-containing protein [ANME-2 cluster archaeon]|nr:PGF-pre-PGF domain-containing protein [ANME-2 cluster archaeon]